MAAGVLILVVLAGVAAFLLAEGFPAFTASSDDIPGGRGIWHFIWTLLFGTVYVAVLALVIATPLSIGIALFISHFAPRRIAATLGYIIDLLAAVPSVIFGLWGFNFVAQHVKTAYPWLRDNLGFLPFFKDTVNATGTSLLTVGIVLAVMIMPIMTAVNREVFLQTPKLQEEAALALGATRFEMVTMTVLPFSRSGIISGAMLGLGRAMGETIAVAMVLSPVPGYVSLNLIGQQNPGTVASNIALKFPEYSGLQVNALIASGLALFILTFLVNFAARAVVARRAAFSGADA
jgi:phosphate transport system permease protein